MKSYYNQYLAKPDKTIAEHSNDLVNCLKELEKMGYVPSKHIYQLTEAACYEHDKGKRSTLFQKRVKDRTGKLKFDPQKEIAHNIVSLWLIDPDTYSKEDYLYIAFAAGWHHAYSDVSQIVHNPAEQKKIMELLQEHPEDIKKFSRKTLNAIKKLINQQDKTAILVKGFLQKCDYAASAGMPVEQPANFLNDALENWKTARPSIEWNAMQQFCHAHQDENIMVVAQTGMGKTEGALRWLGNHKGFYILPLKTAINTMYDRIQKEIIGSEAIDRRIGILHSSSLDYLLENNNHYTDDNMDLAEYYQQTRMLSLPLTVTTLDQLFDFVFKYNGYEVKLATFSYSKMIIDEIQTYGPDLLAYLIYGIRRIGELGGRIAITTATLPPFIADAIQQETRMTFASAVFTDAQERHYLKLIHSELNSEAIIDQYQLGKAAGIASKILVICSTIKKAQALYDCMKDQIDRDELHLFHTRFTQKDRHHLEDQIRKDGRTYIEGTTTLYQKNVIWITTSVVEASLDIDFDYLFTELQDLNSLFQRLGRCNRKGVKPVDTPNCFIYLDIAPGLLKKDEHSNGFIDQTLYDLSREVLEKALPDKEGILSEKDKVDLINCCFTTEKVRKSYFYQSYREHLDTLIKLSPYLFQKGENQFRNILTRQVIPENIFIKHQEVYQEVFKKLEELKKALREGKQATVKTYIIQKRKLLSTIYNDVISIPYYEFQKQKKNSHLAFKGKKGFEQIYCMQCDYDNIKGYRMAESDEGGAFW